MGFVLGTQMWDAVHTNGEVEFYLFHPDEVLVTLNSIARSAG